jgi:rubrerythrin
MTITSVEGRQVVMVTNSSDLFGCPYCGFRIRPTDDACPRCGNSFHENTKFECPFCGDMVSPGADECPSCHINFTEFVSHNENKASTDSIDSLLMDIINLESSQVKKEDKKFSCPKCSWMLEGTEERCPKCGADFTEDATFQCPICGAFVNSNSANCSECGTPFAGDEVAEEQKTAEDHEAFSSALTDILSSAGHEKPPPEAETPITVPPPAEEPPPAPEPPAPELVEAVKEETVTETAPEPVEEPQKAAPSTGPKKSKQRKLKAKTGVTKPSK